MTKIRYLKLRTLKFNKIRKLYFNLKILFFNFKFQVYFLFGS